MNITKKVLQTPGVKKIVFPIVTAGSLLGGVVLYNNIQKTDTFEKEENVKEYIMEKYVRPRQEQCLKILEEFQAEDMSQLEKDMNKARKKFYKRFSPFWFGLLGGLVCLTDKPALIDAERGKCSVKLCSVSTPHHIYPF